MKNSLFFWVLYKKIKFLFDFKKNNYAIVNSMYLCIIFFYSLIIGKLYNGEALDSFASTASIILWGFYMILIMSKKDFSNRIINKFYPISKTKQYLLDFFLSFFDYYLILFSFSGIGLFVLNDNFSLSDLLYFPLGLLYAHTLISILSAFPNYTFYSKIIKFITLLLNVFLGYIAVNYPKYWITCIFFSSLINGLIGYLLFLYTYNKSLTQKETVKSTFIFRKQKILPYLKSLFYYRMSLIKMLESFFWKLTTLVAYFYAMEGEFLPNSLMFAVFSSFLFTPYFHLSYFSNIWGINKDLWLILNSAPNNKRKMILFFLNHFSFFLFIDFLFNLSLIWGFSIYDYRIIVLFLFSVLIFVPIGLTYSILFPTKVSRKLFYSQDSSSPLLLVSVFLCSLYSLFFALNVYFATGILILCSLLALIVFMNVYKNYNTKYKYKMYELFFK